MEFDMNTEKIEGDKKAYKYFRNCPRILDIGCGFGRFISLNPRKIEGVDINPEAIKLCKQKRYKIKKGSAIKLPYKNNSFNGIHCSHVIEHLYPHEAYKLLQEVNRVLKKNGIFVLRTPFFHMGFFSTWDHIKPYYPSAIENILCTDIHIQEKFQKIGGFETLKKHIKFEFNIKVLARGILPLYAKEYMLVLRKK